MSGQAATTALFAGRWSEKTKSPVHPVQAQRIYEAVRVALPDAVSGTLRQATSDDRDLLVEWSQAFHAEIGETVGDPAQVVPRRLRAGQLWLWDDHGPAAMAGLSDAVAGVVRVGPVYTPAARRNCGYASALVTGISSAARTRGERPILYTDLRNPTSNSIYRAIGYHASLKCSGTGSAGPRESVWWDGRASLGASPLSGSAVEARHIESAIRHGSVSSHEPTAPR